MTQLTINTEDKSILPHIKGILKAINGVTIVSTKRKTSAEKRLYNDLYSSLKEVKDSIAEEKTLLDAKDIVF